MYSGQGVEMYTEREFNWGQYYPFWSSKNGCQAMLVMGQPDTRDLLSQISISCDVKGFLLKSDRYPSHCLRWCYITWNLQKLAIKAIVLLPETSLVGCETNHVSVVDILDHGRHGQWDQSLF